MKNGISDPAVVCKAKTDRTTRARAISTKSRKREEIKKRNLPRPGTKKRRNVRRCERVGRWKIQNGARVSKLQILRKSRTRDTQRHLTPSRMHLTAQTMRRRRAWRGYIRAARRWVTGVGVHYNQIPEKRGGKRIKKAICREIIKTKTRATCTRARGGKGALRREKKVERERGSEWNSVCDRTREERKQKER